MEPSLAAVKTFTDGAAKADASAWISIQQSSQILGHMDEGLSRLPRLVPGLLYVPSPLLTFRHVMMFTQSDRTGKAHAGKPGVILREDT